LAGRSRRCAERLKGGIELANLRAESSIWLRPAPRDGNLFIVGDKAFKLTPEASSGFLIRFRALSGGELPHRMKATVLVVRDFVCFSLSA
jgi:hypothetical protein